MVGIKLYFYKVRGGFHKHICVISIFMKCGGSCKIDNPFGISSKLEVFSIKVLERWLEKMLLVKFEGVSIKLSKCGLDLHINLTKCNGFFAKLPSLLDGSEPSTCDPRVMEFLSEPSTCDPTVMEFIWCQTKRSPINPHRKCKAREIFFG
jgi:hypothetical protein